MTELLGASGDATLEVETLADIRRSKRTRMRASGHDPYPASVARTHSLKEIRLSWSSLQAGQETDVEVAVAGRVMFLRQTGKMVFAVLQEGGERLQVMLSFHEIGADSWAEWKDLVDLGDHVQVVGRVVSSRRGELSVLGSGWSMASKALRQPPVLHKQLSPETRVRQRYVDLVVRPEARQVVMARAAVLRAVREHLHKEGYTEVETPVLQSIHGGAAARPFRTHLNAFDQPMSLRIALELSLKKAVVGGLDRVYEMGRIFRNEGVDATHSPEFTMLEAYHAYGDQLSAATLIQGVIMSVAEALGSVEIKTDEGTIDLSGEWRWLPVYEAVSEAVGVSVGVDTPRPVLSEIANKFRVPVNPAWSADKIVLELLGDLVEPNLLQPTFLCDYPVSAQPLARPHRQQSGLIEAWDLIIGGLERGTGFSELVDPVLQREVLTQQSLLAAAGDPEAMELDEDFLRALEYGAPPMGGLGCGIDRLVMLFTGVGIRETILFPHLRPETMI